MIFEESRLKFDFDEQYWDIVQYDAHPDYKSVSGKLQGTKAVDFLGFYNKSLVMFEVKNFRGFGNNSNVEQRICNGMDDLTTEIAQKVRDTIAIITGLGRSGKDDFWIKTLHHIAGNRPVTIIAWVEEDSNSRLQKRKKHEMAVRRDFLAKKLGWLSGSTVSIDNVKEQHFCFEGFSVSPT
jgi:hypothetical protein